jgi:hypothetical protein
MVDMTVKIGNVTLKNPIMPASGAFSFAVASPLDALSLSSSFSAFSAEIFPSASISKIFFVSADMFRSSFGVFN